MLLDQEVPRCDHQFMYGKMRLYWLGGAIIVDISLSVVIN